MAGDGSFDPISSSLQANSSERPQNPLRFNSDEHLQVTGAPPPPFRSNYLPSLPLLAPNPPWTYLTTSSSFSKRRLTPSVRR
ncbi:hypothetical protein LINPERPRIM_LOCUS32889 [Linum perenne]